MLLLLLVSLIWGFSFGLIGNHLVGLPPPLVALVRLGFSLLVFIPFAHRLAWRTGVRLAGVGAVQFGIMYLAYIASFAYLKSYEVALFTVFTPIYVALLDNASRRRFNPANLAAAVLAVSGAGIVSWHGLATPAPLIGFALVQISNACFAFGQVAYRDIMAKQQAHGDIQVFAWLYLGAVAVVLPAGLFHLQAGHVTITPMQWVILAYLGLVASGVCFFLWNTGARCVGGGMLAVLNNAKIPLAVAISLLIFGEHAAPMRLLIGGSVIAMAALLTIWKPDLTLRLRHGTRRMCACGLDTNCIWTCLLLVITFASPAVLIAWVPAMATSITAIRPVSLIIQPLVIYACMLATAAACAWRGQGPTITFGLKRTHWYRAVRDGLIFGIALVPLVMLLSLAMQYVWRMLGLEPTPQDAFGLLLDGSYPIWSRLGLALIATIAAPIAEEAIFRGVLLTALVPRTGLAMALLLQGGLFAAAHAHGPSFIPLLAAGIGFGAGYAANGSLITPIVMHAVFNIVSLALFLAF